MLFNNGTELIINHQNEKVIQGRYKDGDKIKSWNYKINNKSHFLHWNRITISDISIEIPQNWDLDTSVSNIYVLQAKNESINSFMHLKLITLDYEAWGNDFKLKFIKQYNKTFPIGEYFDINIILEKSKNPLQLYTFKTIEYNIEKYCIQHVFKLNDKLYYLMLSSDTEKEKIDLAFTYFIEMVKSIKHKNNFVLNPFQHVKDYTIKKAVL